LPDTHIYALASRLHDRNRADSFITQGAFEQYLAENPHNESRFVHPVAEGPWQDETHWELVAGDAAEVVLRGQTVALPSRDAYARHGIDLEQPTVVHVFELCRYLADSAREQVLATPQERRVSLLPDMMEILRLEEWRHPDVAQGDRPSESDTFHQLAQVLASGDAGLYRPSQPPNTHWRNWPEAGRM